MSVETIRDELFGELAWDVPNSVWSGRGATASGLSFELWVSTGAEEMVDTSDEAQIPRAISAESRATFRRFIAEESDVRRRFAEAHNPPFEAWDETMVTAESFVARVRLNHLTIFRDGTAEVFYADDGMFGGHSLIAHLGAGGELDHAEMSG